MQLQQLLRALPCTPRATPGLRMLATLRCRRSAELLTGVGEIEQGNAIIA
jgi:hypothetical protein